ncbi:MAG: VanW family protein [bacterium]|jgi:vancomycin resistance protein YoaR
MVETVRQMPRRYVYVVIILAAVFLASMGTAMGIRALLTANTIVPGVFIEGTAVGGLTAADAKARLAPQAQALGATSLQLKVEDKVFTVQAEDIGIGADVEETVTAALALGRSGSLWEQLRERYRLRKEGQELELKVYVDDERLTDYLSELAEQVDEPARDGFFILNDKNEMVPVPERPGRALIVDEAKQLIISAVDRGGGLVQMPVRQVIPQTVADLRKRGIIDVVALFSTQFNPADKDRSHNLKLGAEALSGHLIEAGEVFSFNDIVGPREAEQGYLEAPIIINDELVPGIGGGICQVSSTLYNAVLLSGLTPVERLNHSLASAYIGLGRDATVSYGTIDFKFKNTRPEPVMIGTRVDGNQLTMAIFGMPRGEKVDIQTEIEEVIPFPVTYKEDETLPPEADNIKQEGKPGYKVKVTRIIRKDGQIVRQETISRDTYQPIPEIHEVGPVFEEPAVSEDLLELPPETSDKPDVREN